MASERELCKVCGGNGVVKIPGGVSVCNHCEGVCWEPAPVPPSPAEAQLAALREKVLNIESASLPDSYSEDENLIWREDVLRLIETAMTASAKQETKKNE